MAAASNLPYENRSALILKYLGENDSISVETVMDLCHVSASTARSQLMQMHNNHLLVRTHGGALKTSTRPSAPSLHISNLEEKKRIAALAASLIVPGDTVAVGGGSTGICLARELKNAHGIVVVTNSVYVAIELQPNRNIELFLSGGVLRKDNGSCSGRHAESFFQNIYATKSFIGVDSVDSNVGFTIVDPDERAERAILCCANTRYAIFDHTKFKKGPFVDRLASFEDINYCITDSSASEEDIEMLKSHGVEVYIA